MAGVVLLGPSRVAPLSFRSGDGQRKVGFFGFSFFCEVIKEGFFFVFVAKKIIPGRQQKKKKKGRPHSAGLMP